MNQMLSTFILTPSAKRPSPRTKITRRPHIKSKLGCNTCKTRRIKCDETKPICQKCQIEDYQCDGDGYANASSGSGATKRKPTPSPANTQLIALRKHVQSSRIQRPISPPGQSSRDRIAVQYFQNMTLQRPPRQDLENQEPCFSEFDSLTLQLVSYEPEHHNPIWHSLCAVASFSFAFVQEESRRSPFRYQPNTLQHYNQSIRLLKEYASSDTHTVLVILVSCYLFCHVEVLLRNVEGAIRHIQAGIAILRANKMRLSSNYIIFANLFYSIILWGYMDGRITSPCTVKNEYYAYMPDMASFNDLSEATAFQWETICTGLEYARAFEEQKVKVEVPSALGEQAKRHARILISKLEVWSTNFIDLLAQPRMANATFIDAEMIAMLHLNRKLFQIWLPQRLSIGEVSYDHFVDEFEECLDMAQNIYHAMGGNAREHVNRANMREHYLIIYMISIKCRNPTIRQRALEHQRNYLLGNAIWHWRLIVLLAQRVIEIENEEESTLRDSRGEIVPEEHARIHDINNVTIGKQDSEVVVFQFRRRVEGKWQHREETITTNADKDPESERGLWGNTQMNLVTKPGCTSINGWQAGD